MRSADLGLIVGVALGCALVAGAAGLGLARLTRARSWRWQLALVATVGVIGSLSGVLAISYLMLLDQHDLRVVTTVVVTSSVAALVVAVVLGRSMTAWTAGLRAQVQRLEIGPSAASDQAARADAGASWPREVRSLADELAQTRARLRDGQQRERLLEESRRELVSWVAHDLRTPLAGLRAMAEALEDGLAADPARFHRQMRLEVDRTAAMVDDLFELSRIHAGSLVLEPEVVVLHDLVSDTIAGADAVAGARRIRLEGEVEAGLSAAADPAGLARVLSNLVMNAIRHTPAEGTVRISGVAVPGGVELAVSDACGGLPPEEARRVFDVGWQGTRSRSPGSDAGAGLGLAIVKGIVEAHAGRVSVENLRGGDGCRFAVRLPS